MYKVLTGEIFVFKSGPAASVKTELLFERTQKLQSTGRLTLPGQAGKPFIFALKNITLVR